MFAVNFRFRGTDFPKKLLRRAQLGGIDLVPAVFNDIISRICEHLTCFSRKSLLYQEFGVGFAALDTTSVFRFMADMPFKPIPGLNANHQFKTL